MHRPYRTALVVAVVLTVVAGAALFYRHFDPTAFPLVPRCPIKALTGYPCPGCGVQRALHAALNGHIAEAWRFNPFVFVAAPVALFYIAAEALRHRFPRLHRALNSPAPLVAILVAILAWWAARIALGI